MDQFQLFMIAEFFFLLLEGLSELFYLFSFVPSKTEIKRSVTLKMFITKFDNDFILDKYQEKN